jgi:hypothetical protein
MHQSCALRPFTGRARGFATVADNTRYVFPLIFLRLVLIPVSTDPTMLLLLVEDMLALRHVLLLLGLARELH